MALQSDIRIREIAFNPSIYCNCPTTVKVILINMGNAAPASSSPDGKFEVCLRSPAFQTETGNVYRQRVLDEAHQLLPGRTLTVVFANVIFWRTGKQEVMACADCQGVAPASGPRQFEISNDVHHRPCLKVDVDVIPVAWLRMDRLVIDLEDSLGNRNRNVQQLCPGGRFVATATVRNVGCTAAQNFVARLEIRDAAAAVLVTINVSVLAVQPNIPLDVEFRGTVPVPNAPGASYIFSVCLDVTQVVLPQCNRLRLCLATPPIPVAAGGPGPTASLIINSASNSPLYPGQRIPISCYIQNDCSDVGNARARVTLKATGDLLYESGSFPVPPLGSASDSALIERPIDPVVARALYRVGAKILRLEITGTGRNPGPYVSEAPLTITGEAIDDAWWNWDLTSAQLFWKVPYNVGGTFTNRSQGGTRVDVTSVSFREFDDDARPPVPTGETFAAPAPGSLGPGDSVGVVWSTIVQDWVWLDIVNFRVVGPFVKDFGYEATVQLGDEFGNVLNLVVRLDPACGVSTEKREACDYMIGMAATATALVVAAFLVLGIPFGIGAALAASLLGAAATATVLAIGFGLLSNDPPFPDFTHGVEVSGAPRALPKVLEELPQDLNALRSFLELFYRMVAAFETLERTKSKLLAARIDDDSEAIRMLIDAYRKALGVMKMSAVHLPAAMAESVSALRARKALPSAEAMRNTLDEWRRRGIPADAREVWLRQELPKADLERLESLVRSRDESDEIPSVEKAFRNVTDGLLRLAQQAESESAVVLGNTDVESDRSNMPAILEEQRQQMDDMQEE